MKINKFANIDVGNAVPVGDHEAIRVDVLCDALDARPFQGFRPGVGHGDAPVGHLRGRVVGRRAGGEIHGEVRITHTVIVEILLDDLPLVAEGQHKILVTVPGVHGHDMPQHRTPADFDHRLGFELGFFAEPGSLTATQNNNFHGLASCFQI